jgi:hypothetical protein
VRSLVVAESVSLDGVIQAPGHAGEDPEGGFLLIGEAVGDGPPAPPARRSHQTNLTTVAWHGRRH